MNTKRLFPYRQDRQTGLIVRSVGLNTNPFSTAAVTGAMEAARHPVLSALPKAAAAKLTRSPGFNERLMTAPTPIECYESRHFVMVSQKRYDTTSKWWYAVKNKIVKSSAGFLLILASAYFAPAAFSQGFRFDSQLSQEFTVSATAIPGLTKVLTVPASPIIAFCKFPANAVPCSNLATTYNSVPLSAACPTSAQITLTGTTSCVASPDSQGNRDVWLRSGHYGYPIFAGGVNFGPYTVNFGIPSGSLLLSVSCTVISAIQCVSNGNPQHWSGSDPGAWINSAEAFLPLTGGVIDARGLTGANTFVTNVVLTKPTLLMLGSGIITGPSSGIMIDVLAAGCWILGTQSTEGTSLGTILSPVTSAQNAGIHLSASNNGNVDYRIENLAIADSTQGGTARTAGVGIFVDANPNPAQNSIGIIQNVVVSYMYNGIYLNRPINSKVIRSQVVNSKSDGCVTQGDGTSTSWDNTFCHSSGGWDYSQFGMVGVTYESPSTQEATSGGIRIIRQGGTSGNQAVGTNIISPDIEATGGQGLYCLDCIGLNVTGVYISNNTADGVHIDGGRGVTIEGGQIRGSGGCGIDVTQSATPIFPASIFNQGTQLTGNTGGNECGAALNATYSSFSYDGSPSFRLSYPLVATGTTNVSGCNLTAALGGDWAGSFQSGTSGTCTVTITPGFTAPNGWQCDATDLTTAADTIKQTAYTTTTCTIAGTTVSADLITWKAVAF